MTTFLGLVVFLIGFSQCNSPQPKDASTSMESAFQLQLSAIPFSNETSQNMPLPIVFRLSNKGTESLQVNKRLAMGYSDSSKRELYCHIQKDGAAYEGYRNWQLDYSRKRLTERDYINLAPGESVDREIDVQEWYHLDGPGQYRFQVFYQPDPEENQTLLDLGEVSAEFLVDVK